MRHTFIAVLAGILLVGCSTTAPVVGQFLATKDEFMGEASAAMHGTGTLRMRTQSGVSCSGTLERSSSLVSGEGELQCSDGRKGSFVFTKTNEMGGTGFGNLSDGEKFRFLWGNEVKRVRCDKDDSSIVCSRF